MRHLIIATHPSTKSFNHSIVEAYTTALTERGHQVACRDLYTMGFNPILSARDMAGMARGKLPGDIRVELNAIRAADAITLISPLWWRGFPAMLKGYVDRVFSAKFADVNEVYGPRLSGKKGAIIVTAERSVGELRSSGTLRALKTIYDEGLMGYCDIELVGSLYLGGIDSGMNRADGEKHLNAVRRFVHRKF
jgi:NAD(P)H dehydrogenase (quinone)